MPWWAIIYLVVFVAFSIFADTLGESDGTSRLRWFADLLAGAVFAVLFAGFWLPSIYRALGVAAPVLFIAAVGWELYSSPADLREIWRDRELSRASRIGLLILPPLLAWPLYVVAGVGVFTFHDRA
jgi:hypothetical protein